MTENEGAGDRAMEIAALNQIGNTLGLINSQVLEQGRLLNDVRDRVIMIESNRLEAEVIGLNSRVDRLGERMTAMEHAAIRNAALAEPIEAKVDDRIRKLENHEIERTTQIGVFGWIAANMPWLIGILVAAGAIVGFDRLVDK